MVGLPLDIKFQSKSSPDRPRWTIRI